MRYFVDQYGGCLVQVDVPTPHTGLDMLKVLACRAYISRIQKRLPAADHESSTLYPCSPMLFTLVLDTPAHSP